MEKKRKQSRYVTVAKIAYKLAQGSYPKYWHPKSPKRFEVPQLVACVVVMFYMDLSYRDMEEWLYATDQVCEALGLTEIPDHTTLSRTYQRMRMGELKQMQHELLQAMEVEEQAVSIDATGYSLTEASRYYETRQGRQQQHFVKGSYGVGIESQAIVCWRQGWAPSGDARLLDPLRRDARPFTPPAKPRERTWIVLADGGFDGKMARPDDLIPPRRFHGNYRPSPERQARRDLVDAARLDGFFGQRWKVETVFSVIKRKFGDTIRSRLVRLQLRESAMKALVYNIHL